MRSGGDAFTKNLLLMHNAGQVQKKEINETKDYKKMVKRLGRQGVYQMWLLCRARNHSTLVF
jgi:hypothetical protein